MKNKILIVAFLLMASVSVWADSFTFGNLKYTVIDSANRYVSVSVGEVELKGEINIPATATNNNTLYMVTTIGNYAFYGCGELISVTIPEVVTDINNGAFFGCDKLTEINVASDNPKYSSKDGVLFNKDKDKTTLVICPKGKTGAYSIPDSVEIIGYIAFNDCGNLESITIPESVKYIDEYAFDGCSGLTTVTIPNSVISIGSRAFSGCVGLTEINVESSNTEYTSENGILFYNGKTTIVCYPAGKTETTYTIPSSVERINDYAFESCSNLKSLTIPNSVTSIRSNSFLDCDNIEVLEYNTESIYCENAIGSWPVDDGIVIPTNSLKTVVIGDAVTYIDNESFYECSSLTSVTIGDGVTYIGDEAFEYCSSLTSVTIGESVKKIGDLAFHGCVSLGSVNIPNSVTDIGEDAFGGVKNINYSGSATGSPWSAFCLNGTIDGDFIYADAEKTKLAGYFGNETNVTIPDNVTSIGNWVFRGKFTSIIIPNSVKEIEPWAFSCPGATVYLLCTEEEWTTSFDWYWNHKNSGEIVWGYTPTPVTETAANAVNIYAYGRSIVVENAAEEIRVYDAMGRMVGRDAINRVRTEIRVNNPGLYIVKVGNVAKRVVVR